MTAEFLQAIGILAVIVAALAWVGWHIWVLVSIKDHEYRIGQHQEANRTRLDRIEKHLDLGDINE